ncbi:MAG: DUF1343 domain-containing protein, partial [Bacteroidia bacterium]
DPKKQIQLKWLIMFYKDLKDSTFFDGFFNYHSGNTQLQMDIKQGKSEEAIREDWKDDLNRFKAIRKKYLLYKDFE